jgi:hypothetical protein
MGSPISFRSSTRTPIPLMLHRKLVGQLRAGLLLVGTTFAVTMKEEFHSFLEMIGLRDKNNNAGGIVSNLAPSI